MKPPTPKRRWYQFNLRTLFVGTTMSAVALCIGLYVAAGERQRIAIKKIESLGGSVGLVEASPPFTAGWLPTSYFSVADGVELGYTVTLDDDLSDLRVLAKLHRLALENTSVTDSGLIDIKGFTQLQDLDLSGTQVTDQGLRHLSGLQNLRHLWLAKTRVTDAGVQKLQQSLPSVQIHR